MNYSELLRRMPAALQSSLEEEEAYAPWLERGETLERIWANPVVIETVYNRMNPAERTVLRLLVRRIGCEPFDYGRLEKAAASDLSGAEARLGFVGLLRKGFVFAFRKSWGEYVYLLPEDGFRLWQRLLFPEGPMVTADSAHVESWDSRSSELQDDLLQTLVLTAQQGLKLTKNGTLTKKQLQKLLELIRLDEHRLHGAAIKYAYADSYPLKAAVVLDMLLRLQLIGQEEDQFMLQTEMLQAWLLLPAAERTHRLYLIWKQLTCPAVAWMQHAALIVERMAECAEWFKAEDMIAWLAAHDLLTDDPPADIASQLEGQWLQPLVGLGWMEEGREHGGAGVWYRWSRDPLAKGSGIVKDGDGGLIVQPDFDILVPPDVPSTVVWELCCLADLVQQDQVCVYKLTKSSVRRALEHGRTAEGIVQFLERHALYGVPEHVRLGVEQWAKPFGKTRFMQAVLLRCADEETVRIVERLLEAGKYGQEKLGERDFIVSPEGVKPLTAALEKAGFMPGQLPLWSGTSDEQAEMGHASYPEFQGHSEALSRSMFGFPSVWSSEKGLIYSRTSVGYFEMEAQIPSTADLYPELQDIPAVWLRDYRAYHASTRKEIVERAIRMKTALQIRKDGSDYRIVPQKVQETRGTWSMTGISRMEESGAAPEITGEVRLLADEWQEMKLILPGINDKY
ncbi:helicase-associated domain-containing protein [Paenibacillus cremeus]|uniref:Helicase XPB/Ssl2 N-terminal domain-containing protein n=1 Tax=Paenibacillus cremeus TaxID=2163881 RepID=A0A559K9D0_9BACL|nr:helicase-associated domain-containing protein [Paenibacillus cremeus]TVY08727.1 hypothetical protein FPZ49_16865 [Paenibacillus cremeus]